MDLPRLTSENPHPLTKSLTKHVPQSQTRPPARPSQPSRPPGRGPASPPAGRPVARPSRSRTAAVQDQSRQDRKRRLTINDAVHEGGRLTQRDHQVIALLADHQVATAEQLARVAFPNPVRARCRLVLLAQRGVLARFRPYQRPGSMPFHYALGALGAMLHAAATGAQIPTPANTERNLVRLSQSRTLDHARGVVEFFTLLHATARRTSGATLDLWWNEVKAAAACVGIVRPDGIGQWIEHTPDATRTVGFLYEHDTGSEPLRVLLDKISKYCELGAAGNVRPVLVQLPNPARETNLHRAIRERYGPAGPAAVFLATTNTAHLAALGDPAGPIWTPVDRHAGRYRLTALPGYRGRLNPSNPLDLFGRA